LHIAAKQYSHGAGQYISAGHNPAYLFRAATGKIEKLISDAHFLGMLESASFDSRPFHRDMGDILVVNSDSLTDAQNPLEEMFGEDKVLRIIRQEAPAGGQAIEREFLKAIEEFTQGIPQTDDITFVIVERCR
jgi:sigma-B regulation protein RsbU (phosphoserine phosphatase)